MSLASFLRFIIHRRCSIVMLSLALLNLFLIAHSQPANHSSASKSSGPNPVTLVRTPVRPTIDGRLDEAEWTQAAALGEIRQREPQPDSPATERTEVRLLLDQDHLYIGVMCYDSEPDRIVGTQMSRDADITVDDRVDLLLDTFHDRRNAFYFGTNPLGALTDGLVVENRDLNLDWNGIWNVKTHRSNKGWSAEFEIPFKSLSFNPGQDTWGFNFSRTIIRKVEEDRWASPRLDIEFFQVSEAGVITGLAAAEQGVGLDVRPYGVGRWIRDERGHSKFEGDVGGDIFYNITPGLRLTTTINTDFAETEVDNRQINLNRFPLFFPEKRTYFLENVGVFNLAQTTPFFDPPFLPFFSRRIGLLNGQEVPILAGTKLTGKAGKFDVGALAVRTRKTSFTEAKNFVVGRVKRNFLQQSYVGGWFTQGNPENKRSSRTYGADTRIGTGNFLGTGRNFFVDAHAFKTSAAGVRGPDAAYGLGVTYPNDRYYAVAEWKRVESNFRPALGFVTRPATDTTRLGAEFNPRLKPNALNIRQMSHFLYFSHFRRNDLGSTETWRWFIVPLSWDFNSGDTLELSAVPQLDRLFVPFEIARGVTLPKGDYRFTRWRIEAKTAPSRPWQINLEASTGNYWSGRANEISTQFVYKWAPRLQLSLGLDQTFARLREGNFVARIYTARADYAFSPFLTMSNFIQFDNDSRNLGWQARLRWILKPGNDLFLVFNQGWLQDEQRGGFNFRNAETRLTGKIQYTFRF